jgi:maltose O-acetyltransferase
MSEYRFNCEIGELSQLYETCTVDNFSGNRTSIKIGSETHIRGQLLVFPNGGSISIGNQCYVGENSRIWSMDSIKIGDRVLISHNVNIHDNGSHSISAKERNLHFLEIIRAGHPKFLLNVNSSPVIIEDDVWIGFNSSILKGVTIGRQCVIGAQTIVLKSVPEGMLVYCHSKSQLTQKAL